VEGTEQPLHHDYVYALKDEEAYLQADDEKPQTLEPFDPASRGCPDRRGTSVAVR
jgi:hypothetical protein